MRLVTKLTIYSLSIALLPMLVTYQLNKHFSAGEIENQSNINLKIALNGFQMEIRNLQEELFQQALKYSRLPKIKPLLESRSVAGLQGYLLELQESFGVNLFQVNNRDGVCLARVGEWTSIAPHSLPAKIPNTEDRAYFEEDREDQVMYLKSSVPIFYNQNLIGYMTIGRRINRDLLWQISQILNQDVFLFYNHHYLTGTTDPFNLPLDLVEVSQPIKVEPIELKHYLIRGQPWNLILKPIIQNSKLLGFFGATYPLTRVQESFSRNNMILLWVNLAGLVIGIGGAFLLVRNIKGSLFGMEPKEIANLLSERTTLLQSTHEGILAVDRFVKITLINAEAQRMFGVDATVVGNSLSKFIPANTDIIAAIKERKSISNQQLRLGKTALLFNLTPVYHQRSYFGAIATFRDLTELHAIAEELTAIKTYSEALRAQGHEYKNTLHTISGLIQLNCLDEALHLIHRTFSDQQQLLRFVTKSFPHPQLSGILLGKFNRGQELGIKMEITRSSCLKELPPGIYISDLVCIIGNLLENAYDSLQNQETGKYVLVKIKHLPTNLFIKIFDNGPGIPPEIIDRIFDEGFTTKTDFNRGVGLFLVKQCVARLKGSIKVYSRLSKRTLFIIKIPLEVE